MNFKNLFPKILIIIIFACLVSFFYWIFIGVSSSYTKEIVSAFAGAFFAYLFIRFAEVFDSFRQRQKNNYNELVYLERLLNLYLTATDNNKNFSQDLSKGLKEGVLTLVILGAYDVRVESLMNLTDIKYLNKIFGLIITLKGANHDIELTTKWNDELRLALIQKNIDLPKYKEQCIVLSKNVDILAKFFDSLYEKIIDLIAENAVLMEKSQPLLTKLKGKKIIKIMDEEIAKKRREFLVGLEANRQASLEEVEKLTKDTIFDVKLTK